MKNIEYSLLGHKLNYIENLTNHTFYGFGYVEGDVEDAGQECNQACEEDICRCYRIHSISVRVSEMNKLVDFFINRVCTFEAVNNQKIISHYRANEGELKKLKEKFKNSKIKIATLIGLYALDKEASYSISIDSDPYGDTVGPVEAVDKKGFLEFNLYLIRLAYLQSEEEINQYLNNWIKLKTGNNNDLAINKPKKIIPIKAIK